MTESSYDKPLPIAQPESEFFWDKARRHELWLRRCDDCGTAYFYPRDICPHCFSRQTSWIRSGGKGTLHAFSVVYRAPHPSFKDSVPYVAAVIELDEGVRMPSNLVEVEADPKKISIGMAVEVVFDDVTDEVTLPKFRPAGA